MKALVYKGPGDLKVEYCPPPLLAQGYSLIKVSYTGVCGTDVSIIEGKHPRAKAPLIPGHEFSGVVTEIENNAQGIKQGDRVVPYPLLVCGRCFACRTGNEHVCKELRLIGIDSNGGMAEYAAVPIEILYKIPEALNDDVAALIEPLAVVIHGIRESGLKFQDTVLITGAGPIGLLTGLALKAAGVSKIYVTEINDYRLQMGENIGLHVIDLKSCDAVSFIKRETNGEGVDILFEASGATPVALQMTEMVRAKGKIVLLSVHKQPCPVDLRQINFKEISLVGSRVYTRQDFDYAVQYAVKIKEDLARLITDRIPLRDANDLYKRLSDKNKSNTLKILIECLKA